MNNYLVHYGVKGMKWGVRKDKRSVASDNKKVKSKKKIDKKTIAKRIAIAFGVLTGVALGSYVVREKMKIGRLYKKEIIKKGSKLANIATNELDLTRPFYTSLANADKRVYRMKMPDHILGNQNYYKSSTLVNNTVKAVSDLKIANKSTIENTYNELKKVSPGFTNAHLGGKISDYSDFVKSLNLKEGAYPEFDKARHIFYDSLKSQGYSGLLDLNDTGITGWRTKTPTIIFDASDITKNAIKDLGTLENPDFQYFADRGIEYTKLIINSLS